MNLACKKKKRMAMFGNIKINLVIIQLQILFKFGWKYDGMANTWQFGKAYVDISFFANCHIPHL